ncbi:DUF2304 family protein [Candidatus Gottesmanbacteria bacterium]|nr:DUF2304 family protein [Candidatus Gottesmanbacteria bacterium]
MPTITQLFLTVFLLFAASRVVLRFRSGELSLFGFLFWSGIFGLAAIIVLFPGLTSSIAIALGIGRGADVVVYLSVTLLFYLVFRLYIFIEDLRHDITEIVKKIALKDTDKKNDKKSS